MHKLKISDLSVGDWVRWNDKTYRVCLIDGVSLTVELAEEAGETIEVAIDEVTGIPLTPEILEKSGFVRHVVYPQMYLLELVEGENETDVFVDISGGDVSPCGGVDFYPLGRKVSAMRFDSQHTRVPSMLFVHQLQRLYRLAGIEKEIEL